MSSVPNLKCSGWRSRAQGVESVTLTELVTRLEQRAVDAEAIHATAPVATIFRQVLSELEALNPNVIAKPPAPSLDDRWLTARDVAARLGCSPRYVYSHAESFPFTVKLGKRAVRFSAAGLDRWLARRP